MACTWRPVDQFLDDTLKDGARPAREDDGIVDPALPLEATAMARRRMRAVAASFFFLN